MQAHPTLDQLQVFLTVAEQGSFSAAARLLHRTQSVISYSISNLELQLGVELFARTAAKRPQLTVAGKTVLEDARRMLGNLDTLRARVRALNEGLEGELGVAISGVVPLDVVVTVLQAFRSQFPTVSLNVRTGSLGSVIDALLCEKASIGLGGALHKPNDQLSFDRIGYSAMVPVAAPSHALAMLQRPLTPDDVRDHTQLIVTEASEITRDREFNIFSLKSWRVSDHATKRAFLCGGLGWGGMPASLVQDDLARGLLTALPFAAFNQRQFPLYAIHAGARPPGPAGRWLIDKLRATFAVPSE